ncbi:E4, partial [Bettongia penicillata papillomavirus 1]
HSNILSILILLERHTVDEDKENKTPLRRPPPPNLNGPKRERQDQESGLRGPTRRRLGPWEEHSPSRLRPPRKPLTEPIPEEEEFPEESGDGAINLVDQVDPEKERGKKEEGEEKKKKEKPPGPVKSLLEELIDLWKDKLEEDLEKLLQQLRETVEKALVLVL